MTFSGKKRELQAGLEPATYALRMRCATNCATEATNCIIKVSQAIVNCILVFISLQKYAIITIQ